MQLRIGLIALGVAAAISAALALTGTPASAQGPLPPGSYKDSCSNAIVADGVLTAACRMADGTIRASSLPNTFGCVNGVVNANGKLACAAPPTAPIQNAPLQAAKFTANCPGPNFFTVRVAGATDDVFNFRMDGGEKVHFRLPVGSTYALRCEGWPPLNDTFHLVVFE